MYLQSKKGKQNTQTKNYHKKRKQKTKTQNDAQKNRWWSNTPAPAFKVQGVRGNQRFLALFHAAAATGPRALLNATATAVEDLADQLAAAITQKSSQLRPVLKVPKQMNNKWPLVTACLL
jgi:hypothetical protein